MTAIGPWPGRRRPPWRLLVSALTSSAIVAAALAWAITRPDASSTRPAAAFMARFVAADGRVVRPEAGGDTASEEQSYAMLLAAFSGDRAAFDRTWRWSAAWERWGFGASPGGRRR